MSVHSDCEFYVECNDMCLLYFELGFHNISQYRECLENVVFNDSNKEHRENLQGLLKNLNRFLQDKIMDCERIFENANTNTDQVFLKGMLQHGGETNALLMNIGKRHAYVEVLNYLEKMERRN